MKSQWFGFLAILFSVTACAPVTYETIYRQPPGHVSVNSSHRGQTQAYLRPIQVTIYSDSTYTGFNFAPIQVVIADGEYVAIPAKNRRGRSSQIFAHYHQGNLHFDANRNCQKILGSSAYQYDRRWDKGYKYARVNAGHNYDFTGLRLVIRSTPQSNSHPKQVTSSKDLNIHRKERITDKYRVVTHNNKKSHDKKVVDHKPSKNVHNKAVVVAKPPKENKQSKRFKHLGSKDIIKNTDSSNSKKTVRPNIVRELAKHKKTNQKAATVSKRSKAHNLKGQNKSASKSSNVVKNQRIVYEQKSKQVELKRKSTSKPAKIDRDLKNTSKGNRGSVSENRKGVQSAKKKVTHALGLKQSKVKRGR